MQAESGNKKNDPTLDVFDTPVKQFLNDSVRTLDHNPAELEPAIDAAIKEGKRIARSRMTSLPPLEPRILRSRIEEAAYNCVFGVIQQSSKWEEARKCIKAYSSVLLIGAGASFESDMPLTETLNHLLRFCDVDGNDYEKLARDPEKCLRFKIEFKSICERKEVGTSHRLVALNFPRYVREIVCLNWDNLLERAFRESKREVTKINMNDDFLVGSKRNLLWKFHGDVENITESNERGKGGWIFPEEKGYVFDCFLKYVKDSGLGSGLFCFVIIGYGEAEEKIVGAIIDPFEKEPSRPTFRVGMKLECLHDRHYLVGPSDFVLRKIMPLQMDLKQT